MIGLESRQLFAGSDNRYQEQCSRHCRTADVGQGVIVGRSLELVGCRLLQRRQSQKWQKSGDSKERWTAIAIALTFPERQDRSTPVLNDCYV